MADGLGQIRQHPGPLEPVDQRRPQHDQIVVMRRFGLDRGLVQTDALVQIRQVVRQRASCLDQARQDEPIRGPARLAGGRGLHAGLDVVDGRVQVRRIVGPIVPALHRHPQEGPAPWPVGVVEGRGVHDALPQLHRGEGHLRAGGVRGLLGQFVGVRQRGVGEAWQQGVGQAADAGDEAVGESLHRGVPVLPALAVRECRVPVEAQPAECVPGCHVAWIAGAGMEKRGELSRLGEC
ncbi:hypothetical protein [Streptomyces sp. NPDC058548]|uniref:hypothetical protein n=1 Tax=Streptomyces sp. NPDC058548 TaxID=3346545 RepID=UPI003651C2C4